MPFALPFQPPVEPMLAKLSSEIPTGDTWLYEPKWDGFRALVWKAGDQVHIQSRDLKPLGRYFPELELTLRQRLPERCVLDGEIVIVHDGRLDFDAMLTRIHPAASRVAMLAAERPSSYVAWDLLAFGDDDLRARGQLERRERLVAALAGVAPPIHVTPATRDRDVAADWFARFEGAGLDGVMAKPEGLTYQPGKRAMLKIKHQRTAECVVAGFRWYKGGKDRLVGSLLLGLYDAAGTLHHVGVCAGFKQTVRAELAEQLKPLRDRENHPWKDWAEWQDVDRTAPPSGGAAGREQVPDVDRTAPPSGGAAGRERVQDVDRTAPPSGGAAGRERVQDVDRTAPPSGGAAGRERVPAVDTERRLPGATSRWNRGKDLSWEPLRIALVCEVSYDHLQGTRFRHGTHFQRWRPDKPPADCRYDQLEETAAFELAQIFGSSTSARTSGE